MSDWSICQSLWQQHQTLKKHRVSVIKQTQQKLRALQKQSTKQSQSISKMSSLYENTDLVQTLHNIIVNGITTNRHAGRDSYNSNNQISERKDGIKSKQYVHYGQYMGNETNRNANNQSHSSTKNKKIPVFDQQNRRELGSSKIKGHSKQQKIVGSRSSTNIRVPDLQPQQQKQMKNPYRLAKPLLSPNSTKQGSKSQHNTSEQSMTGMNLTRRAQLNKMSLS